MYHTQGLLVVIHNVMWWLGTVALFTACTAVQPSDRPGRAPGEVALVQLNPGAIMVISSAQTPVICCDPPNNRMEYASEGAAMAARSVLNTPHLGHAQLEAVVGALEVPLAPFAAAYGAVKSSQQRIPPAKLSEAELDLREAMRASADSTALREKVADAARLKTSRLLVSAATVSAAPASQVPVSAVLELAVEQLRLEAVKTGASEYTLWIKVRARLLRESDGTVLLDKPYQYQSGPALFIDWARRPGVDDVAQTGYQSLAERIAQDIFQPASEPPLLIGPGHQHSAASSLRLEQADDWSSALLQEADEDAPDQYPAFQFVSLVEDNVTPLEVYAGRPGQRSPLDTPVPGSGDSDGLPNDAEWAMDGLVDDRNAVVQFVSCLAAVPLGLWEQTVGAVLQGSRSRTAKLVAGTGRSPGTTALRGCSGR